MLLSSGVLLATVLLAAGTHPPLWLFALLWAVNGVGQAMTALPTSILLAEHTADVQRGRAYAAHFALTHACWLVTYPAIGYAAATWGTSATFIAAGLVCMLTTIVAWLAGPGPELPHTHFPSSDDDLNDHGSCAEKGVSECTHQLTPGQ